MALWQVVKQCVGTDGVEPEYVRTEVMPSFFQAFWVRRMALDRRNYRQVGASIAQILGASTCSHRLFLCHNWVRGITISFRY